MSRRSFLGLAGAAALTASGGAGTVLVEAATARVNTSDAREGFRFVHLTDIHVEPELRGGEGFRKCIEAVHALKPRPDFILTGGDHVFDILSQSQQRARSLFDLYTSITKDSDIPWRQCIGNHDVLGWGKNSPITPQNVLYGKKMFQERMGLERTTYSFDHKGWHFCVVDDIQPNPAGAFEAGFSEEDLHWLGQDLAAADKRPKVICTHVPVISVTVFRGADVTGKKTEIPVQTESVCRNPGPILNLLRRHRVNLVLTGHQHQNEKIEFDGTTHIEDGAVCGAWWRGPHLGNPEGFGVIDVKADGKLEHQYETYGWHAVAG